MFTFQTPNNALPNLKDKMKPKSHIGAAIDRKTRGGFKRPGEATVDERSAASIEDGMAGGVALEDSQAMGKASSPDQKRKAQELNEFDLRNSTRAIKQKPKLLKRSLGEERADIMYGKKPKSGYERDSGMKWLKANNGPMGGATGGNASRRESYRKAANKVADAKKLQAAQAEDTRQADRRFSARGNAVVTSGDGTQREAFKQNQGGMEKVGHSMLPVTEGAIGKRRPSPTGATPANVISRV